MEHPSWCDPSQCTIDAGGPSFLCSHRSPPERARSGRASLSARLEQLADGLPVVVVSVGVTGAGGAAPVPPEVAAEFARALGRLAARAGRRRSANVRAG